MKRCVSFAVAVLLCSTVAAPVAGQTPVMLFAGAGPSLPVGDFGDLADTGWMAGAGLLLLLGESGAWVGAEGIIGRNAVKDVSDMDWELLGGGGLLGYTFNPTAALAPYVFASAGVLSLKVSEFDSESEFSYGVGGGATYRLSPSASLFASARYLTADDLDVVPITIGFTYMLSGSTMALRR
jgi:opacity protein-like surface antigen